MKFRHEPQISSPVKKPGKNLFVEILLFVFLYALCSLGNLLIVILLLECVFLPMVGGLEGLAVSGDPLEFVSGISSVPYFFIIMLFATVANIIIAVLFCRLIQKRSWKSMGFSRERAFSHYLRGALFGSGAISVAVALCAVTGAGSFINQSPASASVIFLFLLGYLIQGASEEILCRGYFMYSIARRYPMWLAVVVSSVFFALLHMPNSGISPAALVNLFLFGVFAALVTIRTGSIWYAAGYHSAWNFFQGNFYGIKVSGMDMHGSLFHFVSDPSKAILNGGDFGMEGGLLCTGILLIGILYLLYQIRRDSLSTQS